MTTIVLAGVVSRTTKLMPSSIQGTYNYMAPEAFEPPLGIQADVWSMACTVLEMSTGQPPWPGLNMQQIVTAVLVRKRVPEVPDAVPGAPVLRRCTLCEVWVPCMCRCFAFKAEDRATAAELGEGMSAGAAAGELGDEGTVESLRHRIAELQAQSQQRCLNTVMTGA